jgi:predicted nucleotidyltransferase
VLEAEADFWYFASVGYRRGLTMATGTLDALRWRLREQEPELRRCGVRHLSVFGSVARGEDRANSDLDLAVEIEAGRAFSLIRMEDTRLLLEDAVGRSVDLGEVESLRPPVRAAFDRDRVSVFRWRVRMRNGFGISFRPLTIFAQIPWAWILLGSRRRRRW